MYGTVCLKDYYTAAQLGPLEEDFTIL